MSLAHELARRVLALARDDIPDAALEAARTALLDAIGVTLAGAREPCARIVAATVAAGASGPCTLIGAGGRAAGLDAALVNGTAAHALDFDDCHNTVGGHPTAPILPALLAVAEARGASGGDLVTAYVAAVEAMAAVARGVHFHHYRKGWHPTATLGTLAAAAGASRLLGLDAGRGALALAIAASLASGVKANFGTMTKPLHVGHASRNGLLAAELAARGFTASPLAFEHRQGFLEVYNGAGTYDVDAMLDGWLDPFELERPGIAIKAYPCCGSTHPAIDAMLALRAARGLDASAVAAIRVRTHERRLRHTDRPEPASDLEAKFSVQYCVARALLDGEVVLGHFEDETHRAPEARRIMRLVSAAAHHDDNHFGAWLEVDTTDGRTFETYVEAPLGRDREHPLPRERLLAKFRGCASRALEPGAVEAVIAALERPDELADVRDLTALLAARLGRAAEAAT